MRKPKLTYKMVEQAVEMKSHGMSNADICRGLGGGHLLPLAARG